MCRCSLSHGWDCSDDLKASTSKASKQQYSKYSFQSFWWSFNEGKSSYRQGYDWQFGESFTGSSAISRESYLGVQGRKQFDPTVTNFRIKERKVNFLNKVKLRIWTVRTSSALTPSVTMKLSQSHYYHRATIITEPLPSVLVLENESQQPPKPHPRALKVPVCLSWREAQWHDLGSRTYLSTSCAPCNTPSLYWCRRRSDAL